MQIRNANINDAAEIANVHINSWRESYKGLLPEVFLDNIHLNYKNRYETWKNLTHDKTQTTIVAECSVNGIVGFINGKNGRDKGYEDFVEVWSIYLLKHYHGQKIGIKLLKAYFDEFIKKGFTRGYLWVLRDNPSIRFYEKVGAKKSLAVKNAKISGQEIEELCYIWDDIKINLR